MEEGWANYFTNVNDKLASIRLNLSLKNDLRLTNRPWLLWVWLYFQAPREDGLSSSEESATLWKIEDAVVKAMQEQGDAIHCGCITTCSRREFYFYGTTPVGLEETINAVILKYPPYKVWVGSQQEKDATQYYAVLYPSEDQLDSIKNDRVLERLEANGDNHEISREVDHFLYFPNPQTRDAFVAAATANGFVDENEMLKPQSKGQPFGVRIVSTHSVVAAEINMRTKALRTLAEEFAGEYDGWGTTATPS